VDFIYHLSTLARSSLAIEVGPVSEFLLNEEFVPTFLQTQHQQEVGLLLRRDPSGRLPDRVAAHQIRTRAVEPQQQQGPILRNSVSAENVLDKFFVLKFRTCLLLKSENCGQSYSILRYFKSWNLTFTYISDKCIYDLYFLISVTR
jgi:hypothetical protein